MRAFLQNRSGAGSLVAIYTVKNGTQIVRIYRMADFFLLSVCEASVSHSFLNVRPFLNLNRNYSALVRINHKDTKNTKFFKIFFVIFVSLW